MSFLDVLKKRSYDPGRLFGGGSVRLTGQNLVHLAMPSGDIRVVTFRKFKNNVYWYSELMATPCVVVLDAVETFAKINAQRGGLAKSNYWNG